MSSIWSGKLDFPAAKPEPRPVIFIGIPMYQSASAETVEDLMRFAYHCGRRMPEYDFMLGIKSKSEQFRARNAIVNAARKTNAKWLLMLDDDHVIDWMGRSGPNESYDFLKKLIAHDKDVCGVLYYQRGGACRPVLMNCIPDSNGYRFLRDDEIKHELQRVDVAGGGCLLIKTSIFDRIPEPYFGPEHEYGTDIQLAIQAEKHGYEVWADTSIELGHVLHERTVITSQNRLQQMTADTFPGEMRESFLMADVYERLKEDAREYTGHSMTDLYHIANAFVDRRKSTDVSDIEWYQMYPTERICRQVWFNTEHQQKRAMTEFILNSIDHNKRSDILDFGCGIGITAFTLAERGHRVRALDVKGTGTLEFLKWRLKKHNLHAHIQESEHDVPALGSKEFDIIIAMDSLEHLKSWREAVAELARHLKPNGVLCSNNAILDDKTHPEHYPLSNKEFVEVCMENDLMPLNQLMFIKRAKEDSDAQVTDQVQRVAV